MNSKRFSPMKLFPYIIVTLLTVHSYNTSPSGYENNKPFCNQKIQQSLGMIGLSSPQKTSLDMCPLITQSCCKVEDQLIIYKHWVIGKEEENLETRLDYHREVYSDLFNKSIEVYERAKKVMILLNDRSVSNCKVLARRIVNFRIDALAPLLRTSIDHYHTFLKETYKGFYCSVCDAEKTKFIDIKKGKFLHNEEFCRDIVYNSLHVLLYLHAHFTKYLNLLSKFMTSCDYRGVYKRKTISSKYLFSSKADHHRMLGRCHEYRNDINWFDFCEPVCKKFSAVHFNDFFKPNVEKVRKYSRWMGHQLTRHRALEAKDMLLKGDLLKAKKNMAKARKNDDLEGFDDHVNHSRLLQSKTDKNCKPEEKKEAEVKRDEKDDDEEEVKLDETDKMAEEQQKFEEQLADAMRTKEKPDIYRSVAQSNVEYGNFKNYFGVDGLNLYTVGKTTQITENIYDSLKSTITLKRKKQIGYVLKKTKKKVDKWIKNDRTEDDDDDEDSGMNILKTMVVLLVSVFMIK